MDKKRAKGAISRPYIETTKDRQNSSGISKLAKLGAIGYGASKLAGWGLNQTVGMDPSRLRYLSEGLSGAASPWTSVAGIQSIGGEAQIPIKAILLDQLKHAEEMLGGLPRTFGLFGYASNGVFTNANTNLRITGDDLQGAQSHYKKLLGRDLTPEERLNGFILRGGAEGKVSLYGVDPKTGTPIGSSLHDNVTVGVRRWSPDLRDAAGNEIGHHIIREKQLAAELAGGHISPANKSIYQVADAAPPIRIGGIFRDIAEAFVDVDNLETFVNEALTSDSTRRGVENARVIAKSLILRPIKMLDSPIETIEDVLSGGSSTKVANALGKSKSYSYFKNLFGTGGNYSGGASDLLARHATRLGAIAIGGAALYQGANYLTDFLFDKSPLQMGGEVVGAAQRVYAGVSDLTGLTALNSWQEENAQGSHSLLGVMAFPASGYLTGRVLGASTTRFAAEEGEFAWAAARKLESKAPVAMEALDELPVVGKLFKSPMTRGNRMGLIGAGIGAVLAAPFLLGSLGSTKSLAEMGREQSGEDEVAVRKGSGWESGRTSFEGGRVEYYSPGWYRQLMDDPDGELQFADLNNKPFSRMVRGLIDPYWREKEFMEDRPYPVTGVDTTGFGPMGTLWGMTLGRVLKPQAYMHAEGIAEGGEAGVSQGNVISFGRATSDASGGGLDGSGEAGVVSPYDQSFLAGELGYKATEAIGMPGFIAGSILKKFTGRDSFGTEEPVLDSFASMGSLRDRFWDTNIHGGYGQSEALRRVIPSERFQLKKINPVANTQAEWLPGPGSYQDFLHGDPYAQIKNGEYRLPGSGYEARFNELKGTAFEDYPDIHKYRILADVAPHSEEFKQASERMGSLVDSGDLSARDMNMFAATQAQLEEKSKAIRTDDSSETGGLAGKYWGFLKKIGWANPVEHLIPFSPIHKFSGDLDAMSTYQDKQIYSTESPSWDSPISDFLAPAAYNAVRFMGYDDIPGAVQENRDLTGYFDKLEYMKWKKLEGTARDQGEGSAAFAYSKKADFTMYGMDPFADIDEVEKVLPSADRAYFREFLAERDPAKRGEVLKYVPEYTRKFYVAQWQKQAYASLAAKGELSSDEEDVVTQIQAARALEGESGSTSLWKEYYGKMKSGEVSQNGFSDYLRAHHLKEYFEDESPLAAPSSDWIGYDPSVNMEQTKLKVVQDLGKDFHDFDLWEEDEYRANLSYGPTAAASSIRPFIAESGNSIKRSLTARRLNNVDVDVLAGASGQTRIIMDVGMDKRRQIRTELEKQGIRYGV